MFLIYQLFLSFHLNLTARVSTEDTFYAKCKLEFDKILAESRNAIFVNIHEHDKLIKINILKSRLEKIKFPLIKFLQDIRKNKGSNLLQDEKLDGPLVVTYASLLDAIELLYIQLKQPTNLFLNEFDLKNLKNLLAKGYSNNLWEQILPKNRISGYENRKLNRSFSLVLFSINELNYNYRNQNRFYNHKKEDFFQVMKQSSIELFYNNDTNDRLIKINNIKKELYEEIIPSLVNFLKAKKAEHGSNLALSLKIDNLKMSSYAKLLDAMAILYLQLLQPMDLFLNELDLKTLHNLTKKAYSKGLWKKILPQNRIVGYENQDLTWYFSLRFFAINSPTSHHFQPEKLFDQKLNAFNEMLIKVKKLLYNTTFDVIKLDALRKELHQKIAIPLIDLLKKEQIKIHSNLNGHYKIDGKSVSSYGRLLDGIAILNIQLQQPQDLFLKIEDLNSLVSLIKKAYTKWPWEKIRPENRILGYEQSRLPQSFSLRLFAINNTNAYHKQTNKFYGKQKDKLDSFLKQAKYLLYEFNGDNKLEEISKLRSSFYNEVISPLLTFLRDFQNEKQAALVHIDRIEDRPVTSYAKLLDRAILIHIQLKQPFDLFLEKSDFNHQYNLAKRLYTEDLWQFILPENRIPRYENKRFTEAFSIKSLVESFKEDKVNQLINNIEVHQIVKDLNTTGIAEEEIISLILKLYYNQFKNVQISMLNQKLSEIITFNHGKHDRKIIAVKRIIKTIIDSSKYAKDIDLERSTYHEILLDTIRPLIGKYDLVLHLQKIIKETASGNGVTKLIHGILQEVIKTLYNISSFDTSIIKKKLMPYQIEGALFLSASSRRILTDETGLGKSIEAIAAINYSNLRKIVWVTTNSNLNPLKLEILNTENNIMDKAVYILGEKIDFKAFADAKYILVSFSKLAGLYKSNQSSLLFKDSVDLLVIDEAHLVDKSTTLRSLAVRDLSKLSDRIWMLTASLYQSNPIRIFYILNILEPTRFNNYNEFKKQFANDIEGAHYLRSIILNNYMLRRNKLSVAKYFDSSDEISFYDQLLESPRMPKMIDDGVFKFNLNADQLKAYKEIISDFGSFFNKFNTVSIRRNLNPLLGEDFFSQYNAILRVIYDPISLGLGENANYYNAINNWVNDRLINKEQVVLWGWNTNVLKNTMDALTDKKRALIHGKTSLEDRSSIINDFNDGKIDVLVANYESMGIGINLPNASRVLFIQPVTSFSKFYQTMGRHQRVITLDNLQFAKESVYTDILLPNIEGSPNVISFLFERLKASKRLYHLLIDGIIDNAEVDSNLKNELKTILINTNLLIKPDYLDMKSTNLCIDNLKKIL